MAVPKRRHSSTRGKKRRTHWKIATHSLSSCPQCGQSKLPHRACPRCGFYKGEEVTPPKSE